MTESAFPAANLSLPPVSSVSPAIATLNPTRLEMIAREASPEFLIELAQLFTKDVEERIRCLAIIVHARDVTGTADAAHGVQSAATSLGVMRLRSLAASLEKHAEGEDWRRVELALARLQSEFAHVKQLFAEMSKAG